MKAKLLKVLSLLACLSLSAGVVACDGDDSDSSLVFTLLEDDTYAVTDYMGKEMEVVIPSVYENKPVTSIGKYAFSYCEDLTEVVIPDSVTSIGSYAFYNCDSLTEVIIPDRATLPSLHPQNNYCTL